jgi:mannose-6-phosphate isomerase-like protein (cupin superfamily)
MEQGSVPTKISKRTATHYKWGVGNDGWRLVNGPTLSIIHERMPSGGSEEKHYHEIARQFFFVLEGQAEIEIEGETVVLGLHEGIEVAPMLRHRIFNRSDGDVEFIVCSQPSTDDDRLLCVG